MPEVTLSDIEIAEQVDALIEDYRIFRNEPEAAGHRTYVALKQIAKMLRATAEFEDKTPVGESLRYHVESAGKAKARLGYYEAGNYQAVAECVLGNWETIKRALALAANGETK